MNLTVTSTIDAGFFTVYAAQTPRREVSNLNVTGSGQTVANHAITRISTSGVACYSYGAAHIICDVMGWYTGRPEPSKFGPPVEPPPPGGPLPWIVQIPRLGLTHKVYDGNADRVVNSGNTWHWSGTGLVGQGGNIVLFGHRTEYGGPYRYQHLLRGGDELYIYTSDSGGTSTGCQRSTSRASTPPTSSAATRRLGGETISVVSCSRTDRLPTSLRHRLVTTFTLDRWEDLG